MNASSTVIGNRILEGQELRLQAITDNLANASAPGYRKVITSKRPFDAILNESLPPGSRPQAEKITMASDFSQGALRGTGNALDFAIEGRGFFVVEKDNTRYYTRDGSFHTDPEGNLVNNGGFKVMARNGAISLPRDMDPSKLSVAADGTLTAEDRPLGQLDIAEFDDPALLIRAGTRLFVAPENMPPQQAQSSTALNRTLEGSNTSVFEEMTELIECTRFFESCQRLLKAQNNAQNSMIKTLS